MPSGSCSRAGLNLPDRESARDRPGITRGFSIAIFCHADYARPVITIEMSVDHYDRFVALCDPASREYAILKNGVPVRRPRESHFERVIEILCDTRDAQLLLALAEKICRVAVPAIEKAMRAEIT